MSNPNAHDIKVLNGLIETTLDSADGYREAAEQTQDPHYRTLFERRSSERQQVVDDLVIFLDRFGAAWTDHDRAARRALGQKQSGRPEHPKTFPWELFHCQIVRGDSDRTYKNAKPPARVA